MNAHDEILVPEEICDYLRIKRAKFYYMAPRGKLSFLFKVGNEWRARKSDLEEWIQNNTSVVLSISERSTPVEKELEVEEHITTEQIQALISEQGYEVTPVNEGLLNLRDPESGIVMHTVLQDNVLFCTVSCLLVPAEVITPPLMRAMLSADNGISTSGFQLYDREDGKVAITLNNFCKLQNMGEDDQDDIVSCLEFLVADVVAAHTLLAELVS